MEHERVTLDSGKRGGENIRGRKYKGSIPLKHLEIFRAIRVEVDINIMK